MYRLNIFPKLTQIHICFRCKCKVSIIPTLFTLSLALSIQPISENRLQLRQQQFKFIRYSARDLCDIRTNCIKCNYAFVHFIAHIEIYCAVLHDKIPLACILKVNIVTFVFFSFFYFYALNVCVIRSSTIHFFLNRIFNALRIRCLKMFL